MKKTTRNTRRTAKVAKAQDVKVAEYVCTWSSAPSADRVADLAALIVPGLIPRHSPKRHGNGDPHWQDRVVGIAIDMARRIISAAESASSSQWTVVSNTKADR